MKKILSFVLVLSITGLVFAQNIGLDLEVGGQYANSQRHSFTTEDSKAKFHNHIITHQHMGGFNVGINYAFTQKWAVFFNSAFSFNSVFLNDTVLGIGYNFSADSDKVKLFLGGGLAFGGLVDKKDAVTTSTERYFNVGVGVQGTATYMITKQVGIHCGLTGNIYGIITGHKVTYTNGKKTSSVSIDRKTNPYKFIASINAKAGLTVAF